MSYNNFFISDKGANLNYKPRNRNIPDRKLPEKNHKEYGDFLKKRFTDAWDKQENNSHSAIAIANTDKIFIEYISEPEEIIPVTKIEDLRSNIRVLNVKEEIKDGKKIVKSLISFPKNKKQIILNKLDNYASDKTNDKLWSVIQDIKEATISSLWTGPKNQAVDNDLRWYEVWIHNEEEQNYSVKPLLKILDEENIVYQEEFLVFPEKIVLLIYINSDKLRELIINFDSISEVRPASNINEFFSNMDVSEQFEWADELSERLIKNNSNDIYITILDGGINRNHPLLSLFLTPDSQKVYNAGWGVSDFSGHGTKMAGIATYSNLSDKLTGSEVIEVKHEIESAKIMNDSTGSNNDPKLYGAIMKQVASDLVIDHPERNRIYCMAVTAENNTVDDGRPTSWSAAIDDFSFGRIDNDKKLFILSAGNIRDDLYAVAAYPHTQKVMSIENPGQSWNAITVGAITNIPQKNNDGTINVADFGQLSPYTRTSLSWENKKWPIKPEIVLEGGNARLIDNQGFTSEDTGVITTNNNLNNSLFNVMHGTSPSTAQASFIASELMDRYPNAWPETIRALIIHSASWTPQMEAQLLEGDTKTDYENMLRCVGYGVPSLSKAIESVEKRVNLVIESEIKPFIKNKQSYIKLNEMKIFKLPWPKEVLQSLYDKEVTIKVTLSYFIEPGPGEKGWNHRYRYPSVGLRFDINGALDTKEEFMQRINQLMIEDGDNYNGAGSINWKYGTKRNVGSIHSDIWTATGADISNSEYIAVYPVTGWWKERKVQNRYDDSIRFSLVVSLETDVEVDLYTPIYNQLNVPLNIEV